MTTRRALIASGLVLGAVGTWIGLFVAPPEKHMGVVQKIMYVHVPSAWICMLLFTLAFGFAIASLWTGRSRWDDLLVGSIEVGVVLNALLLVQGSIWGRATWGVWWDWDVRLTTSLVMLLLFAGVLLLRSMAPSGDRRVQWSAVATIIAWIDVPLVYYCVRWWRSLHQIQSSPETVDAAMVLPLRINAVAMLLLGLGWTLMRAEIERRRRRSEEVPLPDRLPVREEAHA